eukprot:403363731
MEALIGLQATSALSSRQTQGKQTNETSTQNLYSNEIKHFYQTHDPSCNVECRKKCVSDGLGDECVVHQCQCQSLSNAVQDVFIEDQLCKSSCNRKCEVQSQDKDTKSLDKMQCQLSCQNQCNQVCILMCDFMNLDSECLEDCHVQVLYDNKKSEVKTIAESSSTLFALNSASIFPNTWFALSTTDIFQIICLTIILLGLFLTFKYIMSSVLTNCKQTTTLYFEDSYQKQSSFLKKTLDSTISEQQDGKKQSQEPIYDGDGDYIQIDYDNDLVIKSNVGEIMEESNQDRVIYCSNKEQKERFVRIL